MNTPLHRAPITRRSFLQKSTAAVVTGVAFPTIVSSSARAAGGQVAPSNRITVGIIGTGGHGVILMKSFLVEPEARIIAVCGVDRDRVQRVTGEPIGVLGAQGIADWTLRNRGIHTTALERALGHPLMTLNNVYEATGDEKYLRGSAHLVDQALKWENPVRSGFPHQITESPAYYSGCPFNAGMTFSALMKFNAWANLSEGALG